MTPEFAVPNTLGFPLLSFLVFLPLAGAVVALALKGDTLLKIWALIVTVVTAAVSVPVYVGFQIGTHKYQFLEAVDWIPSLNIQYILGIDGISLLLIMLTTFVMPLCVLCSWKYIQKRWKEFVFSLLLMETAMLGVFCALDLVLFYVFWEAMLIPMYLLIAVWGGPRKAYASVKFFLYTLAGSVLLLVAIIALYVTTGTFVIPELMQFASAKFTFAFQFWVFLAFALAFAIKVPMFPFHTWLPAAHVEAPTAGSVILASVLLKMGTYGFLRFCLPLTPLGTAFWAPVFLWVSIASILYGGFVALGQTDIKKLIAYSSVGHMGFVTLGIFLLNAVGIKGAILQMVNHGITTGALFICVGIIYERTHSREISANSALAKYMPFYLAFLVVFSLSSLAFPGTNSFVGELYVLIGAFQKDTLLASLAIPGALLAATYMLRLLQKMIWAADDGHDHGHGGGHGGEPGGDHGRHLWDLDLREAFMLAVLTGFVFWIGLNPRPFVHTMEASVDHLVDQAFAYEAEGYQGDAVPDGWWSGVTQVLGGGGHGAGDGGGHGAEPSHGGEPQAGHGEAPAHPTPTSDGH
ncbi:MAG: NADH-quinone oxidoreductase subunit M [Deferrisomatales bacterium]|nr:NADH-quinone oxidoreductase subunit M [Deferrisomatales bacterium]